MHRSFELSDFDFALPAELIAQHPAPERTASRLMHVDGERIADLRFTDVRSLVEPGDVLVFNDTRVIKARLFGTKPTGGKVEVLVERVLGRDSAMVQLRASHPPAVGSRIAFERGIGAKVIDRDERFLLLSFNENVWNVLDAIGEVPLPPYIHHKAEGDDASRYQTVYARQPGAVAAPTAGLHFDPPLLSALEADGVVLQFLTLHVGAGTFLPVQAQDLSQHRMHSESFEISDAVVEAIAHAKRHGKRVIAVGTTSLRALEAASRSGTLEAASTETDLFITPGFRFHTVDRLITNFHLPKSTLLMLVSAFAGYDAMMRANQHAIAQRYRFFSYGDAMLLERAA